MLRERAAIWHSGGMKMSHQTALLFSLLVASCDASKELEPANSKRSRPPFESKGPVPRPRTIKAARRLVVPWLPDGMMVTKREHIPSIDVSLVAYPSPSPEDTPEGERVQFRMPNGPSPIHEGRYYFPPSAELSVYDLRQSDEQSHPSIWKAVRQVRGVLAKKPSAGRLHSERFDFNRDVFPPVNAAQQFHAHLRYLETAWGKGYLVLTQFGQDNSTRVNNDELFCLFVGLSSDGSRYLTGSFPVTHTALPSSIDDVAKGDLESDVVLLNRLSSEGFVPKLDDIEKLVRSIELH